jgi:hypothetical protein
LAHVRKIQRAAYFMDEKTHCDSQVIQNRALMIKQAANIFVRG